MTDAPVPPATARNPTSESAVFALTAAAACAAVVVATAEPFVAELTVTSRPETTMEKGVLLPATTCATRHVLPDAPRHTGSEYVTAALEVPMVLDAGVAGVPEAGRSVRRRPMERM